MNNSADYVRMNVILPAELVSFLKKKVPPRGISKFLAEATREKIAALEREKALKELLDAPPAFTNIRDSAKYIRKMRRLDERRMKRLGI
ncbi:hypothetical protein FJY90_07965 [Candidatus Gottesmanbacteria bacterium]|nr:hypothetical protein [Candidatus Gottesmanbacteria bacterium]